MTRSGGRGVVVVMVLAPETLSGSGGGGDAVIIPTPAAGGRIGWAARTPPVLHSPATGSSHPADPLADSSTSRRALQKNASLATSYQHNRGEQLGASRGQIVHPQRADTAGVVHYAEDSRERGRREMARGRQLF